jgi:methionyl-tRNA synthetase
MISKYREGRIPDGKIAEENYIHARRAGLDPDGGEIVSVLEHARDEYVRRFDAVEFSHALELLWTVIARIDQMITDPQPWVLASDERQAETLNAVLYRSAETLRWLSVMLYPVMPVSAEKIYRQIGLKGDQKRLDPANLHWGELAPGTTIGETEAVFPRIEKANVMSEIKSNVMSEPPAVTGGSSEPTSLAESKVQPPATAGGSDSVEDFISIDDFLKVELRVGEVKIAERVPNADKLLRLEVDLGEDKPRQLLAGLAEYYDPDKLIGRKVVVVANLKPRKMRGLESQGMICAASLDEEDPPALATVQEDVKIGARLKYRPCRKND